MCVCTLYFSIRLNVENVSEYITIVFDNAVGGTISSGDDRFSGINGREIE